MAILERFQRHDGGGISRNASFRLTQSGQEFIAQRFEGNPRGRILCALETQGTSNVEEIARSSGLSAGLVERQLAIMIRSGLVQPTGMETMEA